MTRDRHSLPPLFNGLETPEPPAELRDRVLAGSMAALAAEPVADLWTRIWHNRPLRLAWAMVVVALVAAHVVMIPTAGSHAAPTVTIAALADPADEELAEIAHLPRLRLDARSWAALNAAITYPTTNNTEGGDHPGYKENPA